MRRWRCRAVDNAAEFHLGDRVGAHLLSLFMVRQLDLFATGAPAFDAEFKSLRRTELSHGAWIAHAPGWVSGQDALFDDLETSLPWRRETMKMYDKIVNVPRLIAQVPHEGIVEAMRVAISARLCEEFVFTTAAFYRNGNDSVAFHGDTTARNMIEAQVATVSLGSPRKFVLRPALGGASIAFSLGGGDLFVMGGTCQRTWRHGIPKVASAGPRIALMFRPKWAANYRTSIDARPSPPL